LKAVDLRRPSGFGVRADFTIHTYIILQLITNAKMPAGAQRIEENMVFY
jgi:hypothetical protein